MSLSSRNIDFAILAGDEELQNPRLHRLYMDWKLDSAGGTPPFDFADVGRLAYLLGFLIVLDVERDDADRRRYSYRMIGTQVIERRGRDRTGEYLDQHPEARFAAVAIRACDMVVETRRPVHGTLQREIDGQVYPVEILVLPLGDADRQVGRILAAEIYPDAAPRRGGQNEPRTPSFRPARA